MKRSPVTIRRLLAVLVISFLLCGAGTLASSAAPIVDQPGSSRAPVAAARQQADPGTATAPEAPVIDVTLESAAPEAPAGPESVATVSCSGVRLLHGESLTAYTSIQSAISAAVTGDKILVSGGCNGTNYTSDNGQDQTVRVPASAGAITIEGGYDGTDWSSAARDPIAHPTTLNAERQGRVVWVEAGADVTLRDLIIRGGSPSQDGAGIYNLGTLTIEGCTIQDNPSTGTGARGGGIFSNGTLNVWRSTITGNAVANAGGGIYVYDGTAQIVHSTISGNSVNAGNGGGIGVAGSATVVELLYSTVTDNHAAGGGGIDRYNGTISFKGSIIAGNTGGSSPDCIGTFTSNGYNLIGNNSGCTFTAGTGDQVGTPTTPIDPRLSQLGQNIGPTPTHLPLHGSPAIDAGDESYNATTYGETDQRGAPRVFNSRMDIGAVEINPTCFATADNGTTVYSGEAGVVQAAVNVATSGGTVKVAGVCRGAETRQVQDVLDDMVSKTQMVRVPYTITAGLTIAGGYDSSDWSAADPVAHPTTLDALGSGRVFYIEQDTHVTLQGLTIAGGHAADGTESSNGDDGGGIYNLGALTVATSTVKNNSAGKGYGANAGGYGGGIYSGGNIGAGLIVTRTSVISNSTDFQGGGLYLYSSSTIEQSTISGNRSGGDGGGIYNGYGTLALRFSTVTDNDAYGYNAYGGGVFNYSGRIVNTSGSIIAKNSSYYSANSDCRGTITSFGYNLIGSNGSCTFNAATGDQVGSNTAPRDPLLSSLGDYGGPTPTHVMADNSPARDAGDPGYNPAAYGSTDQRGLPRVVNGRIEIGATELQMNCWATPDDGTHVYASAGSDAVQDAVSAAHTYGTGTVKIAGTCKGIGAGSVLATLSDITLAGGYVNGAWNAAPDPVAHPTTLDANHEGRVLYIGTGYTVTLVDLNIINGTYAYDGAGIYHTGEQLILERCTVRDNSAGGNGGGIFSSNYGNLTVRHSLIAGNMAAKGGGIFSTSGAAIDGLIVSDSTLTENRATDSGGAVYIDSNSGGWLGSSTIYSNTADGAGGGLYLTNTYGSMTVDHTILADNTGGNCGGPFPDDTGHNIDSGNTCGFSSSQGSLNNTNPQLGSLADNGGPTLTCKPALTSPALNGGDDTDILPEETDQRGLPRVNDGQIDIGAVETQFTCYTTDGTTTYKSENADAVQAAIDHAPVGGTVKLEGTCHGVSTAYTSTAHVPTNLTLEGGHNHLNWDAGPNPDTPAILDAGGAGQVVQITSAANVTLRHLVIRGGASPEDGLGGGVNNQGALTVDRCKIDHNAASTSGGGIYSTGPLTMMQSSVDTNTAASGGGIYATAALRVTGDSIVSDNRSSGSGGGIYSTAPMTVEVSHVSNNMASGGSGGGIYGTGPITLSLSTVAENTADSGGGGIAAANAADLNISGGLIVLNSAGGGGGGGVLANAGAVKIEHATFDRNTTTGCGGGLRNETGSTATIKYSTFSGNTATGTGGDGAAICVLGAVTIKNSTLGVNTASAHGGGIWNSGTTTISASTLYGNGSATGGAMVYKGGGTVSVTGSIFAGKTGGQNCSFATAGDTITDGGYNLTDEAAPDSCGFASNAVHQSPNLGPLQNNGGNTLTYAPGPTSPAFNAGDPDYTPEPDETDQRLASRINGGRIDIGAVEVGVNCIAKIGDTGSEYGSMDGSAVQAAVDAAIKGDTIKVAGTCASLPAGSSLVWVNKELTLEGGYDQADWAAGPQPGVYTTTLDALNAGRVVDVTANNVTLRNLTITGGHGVDGGGVAFGAATGGGIVDTCVITGNQVTGRGGGVFHDYDYAGGSLTIRNSTISHNSAVNGGGVYVHRLLTIEDSTISYNTAATSSTETDGDGGGVWVSQGGDSTISRCTITGNVTDGSGGGLYGWFTITDSTFSNNRANVGGGWQAMGDGGGLDGGGIITNSLFENNDAFHGGGVNAWLQPMEIRNCTFSNNTAAGNNYGHAIMGPNSYGSYTINVTNSTFVNNGVSYSQATFNIAGSIFQNSACGPYAFVDAGYNLVDSTSSGCAFDNPTSLHASNILLGPLQDNGGPTRTYKPDLLNSPAVDAGNRDYVPAAGETDQRGLPRVNGGRIDIGAVEVQAACWAAVGSSVYRTEDGTALQDAIDAASAGATVKTAGCTGVDTVDTLQQTAHVAKNLTIEGGYTSGDWGVAPDPVAHPTRLDANHEGRGVYIASGATVTLRNLNIVNGVATENGGGIRNAGALTVENSAVQGSQAVLGGGIYNGGTLAVTRSLIADNTATSNGAGIYSPSTATSLNVSHTTLTNNIATGDGGAIWSQAPTGTVEQCTLVANSASSGGGVYGAAALNVKGTILASNTGGNCAGAVTNGGYNIDSAATCGFGTTNGSQSSTPPKLGALADNGGPTQTFLPLPDSPAINTGNASYNPATSGTMDQRGLTRVGDGRIDIGAAELQAACWSTISGTPTYRSEDAGAVQMAIDAAATDATVKLAGTCAGVSATYLNTANVVKNLTLEGGYSHSSWSTNNPADYPTTLDAGGAGRVVRIAAAASVTLSKMTITGGQGNTDYGGGVFNDGSGTLTVDSCTIKSNTAGSGAGIYSAGTLMIKNSTIITNTASASGGGIYGAADVTIEGGKIGDTTAGNGNVAATGGGIYSDGYLHLTSTTLGRNRASGSGGGAYVDSHLSITNTQVLNNSAGGDGGGLWGNGGFYVGRSTISSNTAANGGGLYTIYANTPTIEDSTISYNTASGSGGGINAYPSSTSKLWITRTNVSHNSAANGGGIYSLAYWVEIYYSQVEYNTATSNGGGVAYNIYGTYGVRTRYSTFRNNSASVDGGAIYSANDVKSIGSTFGANRAGGKGGAIALYRPSGSGFVADISRSTFNDNDYTGTGGSGAVIWVDGGWTLYLDNNIFVNPTSSTHAYIGGSGTKVDLGYNLDRSDTIGLTATGSITDTDPLLNSLSYYGGKNLAYWVLTYLPKQGSPVIDKGDPNVALIGSETDGRGYTRVFGGTIDIGAVEVQDECFATYDDGVTIYHGEGDAIQRAVTALPAGKTSVKVAGRCKGPGGNVALLTIGKTVAIEGGYGPDSWQTSDPVNRPTLMDADARNRVVVVNTGVTTSTLRSLNMTGGVAHNGGGIYVNSSATLFIANSNLYGNGSAGAGVDYGGGILNAGSLTVEGSAIYSNTSPDIGAGIYNSGNVKIINSTVISNSVALWGLGYRGGGGLYNAGAGVATVVGSTFAGNSAAAGANIYQSTATGTTGYTTIAATIITNPLWGTGSSCNTTLRSGGYNRISSSSCVASGETDKLNATIQLGVPGYNGGGTLNLLPQATGTNDVLDVVPENTCRALFSGKLEDQARPAPAAPGLAGR